MYKLQGPLARPKSGVLGADSSGPGSERGTSLIHAIRSLTLVALNSLRGRDYLTENVVR
jgi:hypothetical protein